MPNSMHLRLDGNDYEVYACPNPVCAESSPTHATTRPVGMLYRGPQRRDEWQFVPHFILDDAAPVRYGAVQSCEDASIYVRSLAL